ncbi:MAG: LLM class flavin-dependent oxidoreductase [Chloroflexi bacterium]|nr:LLM class flavin-dependent oxidoreductase [Chloroflexota bacterium]
MPAVREQGPRTGVWLFPAAPAPRMVEFVEHAERLGLDEIWLGDEGPARDPLGVLAAAAVRTRSIRLAVGVTNPYVRHPAMTAVSMMTIHELSAGRAIVGLGVGGNMALDPLNLTAVRPVQTIRDALQTIRAVTRGESGGSYRARDGALQSPDLPIFVGSRSPRINHLASALADGAFVAGLPVSQVAEVVGWARSSRRIPVAVYISAAFEPEDVERARPEMAWGLANSSDATVALTGLPRSAFEAATAALQRGDREPARTLMTDDVLRQMLVWGSPEDIGARLAQLVHQLQPDSIGLSLLQDDVPRALEASAATFAAMRRNL